MPTSEPGGACGEIKDEPLESSFGYVSVLLEAFSAYRYHAIQGRLLEQYFHGDNSLAARRGQGNQCHDRLTENMCLVQDRIAIIELVAQKGGIRTLTCVKASQAETDVLETATELIG